MRLRALPSLSDAAPNTPERASHSSPSSPSRGVSENQSARPGDGDIALRVTNQQRAEIAVALVVLASLTGEDHTSTLDLVLGAGPFMPARVEPGCVCNARDEWASDSCPVHGDPEEAA